eukprot:g11697.t1
MAESGGVGKGDGSIGGGGEGGKSGGNDEKLAQFMAVTGVTSEDIANHWLEANAFSLESAVNMFMESSASGAGGSVESLERGGIAGHGGGASASAGAGLAAGDAAAAAAAAAAASGPRPGDPDYVRPADPYKRQRLVDDAGSNPYGGMATASRSFMGPVAPGTNPFRDFQEESRQAVLAQRTAFSVDKDGAGRSSDPQIAEKQKKLATMFSPPASIMFMGDFQSARQAAKQQKKWLLVNIQADSEFDCHRLNRDLWKDEMVQNIIECNCIFWQQPSISQEAKLYCQRYHASGFPHMALVDPRTGMKVWDFQGFLGPPEFIEKVTDLTDKISLEDGAPARLPPPPPRPPQLPPSTGGSEDQMLAAAIAASLDTSGGGGGGGGDGGVRSSSGSSSGGSGVDAGKSGRVGGGGGGGHGVPVATVAGGAISVDGSDEDEDGDANGDVAVVAPPSSSANAAPGAAAEGAGAAAAAAAAAAAGGKQRRHGKGRAREEATTTTAAAAAAAAAAGEVGSGSSAVTMGVENGAAGSSSGDVVDVTGEVEGAGAGGKSNSSGSNGASAATADAATEESAKMMNGQEEEEEEMVEEAPGDDCPDSDKTSVRFQFPTGARELRKFRKASSVRQLFLFVRSELEGAKTRPFDIRTVRPPSSVRSMEGGSIQDAGLSNSAVVVVWED